MYGSVTTPGRDIGSNRCVVINGLGRHALQRQMPACNHSGAAGLEQHLAGDTAR